MGSLYLLDLVSCSCPISIRGRHQVAPEVLFSKGLKEDEVQGSSHSNEHLGETKQQLTGSIRKHTPFCPSRLSLVLLALPGASSPHTH